MQLRIRPANIDLTLDARSSLAVLRAHLEHVTRIQAAAQRILMGYPPRQLLGAEHDTLTSLGVHGGETLIVEAST